MRVEIKKWGNGLAIRLPKKHPSYGELRPGMQVDVEILARKPKKAWEPYVVDMGPEDLSQRHREYTEEIVGKKTWHPEDE